MSIKTLIIGCGAVIHEIYRKPLIRLQKQRDLTIIGLVDPNQAHTEALKTIFRTQAVYDNVDDAVAKCGAELAIISSPLFYTLNIPLQPSNRACMYCVRNRWPQPYQSITS